MGSDMTGFALGYFDKFGNWKSVELMPMDDITDDPKSLKSNSPSISIDHVKFSGPATIVFWDDGTKTIVKCMEDDTFDAETGVAMCTLKKIFGNSYSTYKKEVAKKIKEAKQKATVKAMKASEKEIKRLIKKKPSNEDIIMEWLCNMIKKDSADE